MILHQNIALFRDAVRVTAQQMNIPLEFVEKDCLFRWNELKTNYKLDFKNLVYTELPKEEAVLETLKMIQERLKAISWTIKI